MHSSKISISEVKYYVHLGCTPSEQAQPQEVRISVIVEFAKLPDALETDRLEDSLCYAEVCDRLDQVCSSQNFSTIEYLASHCWKALTNLLDPADVMTLTVLKVSPPIGRSLEGCSIQLQGTP